MYLRQSNNNGYHLLNDFHVRNVSLNIIWFFPIIMKIFKHIAKLNFTVNAHVATTSILSLSLYYTCINIFVSTHHLSIPALILLIFDTIESKLQISVYFTKTYIILFEYLQKACKIGFINSILQMKNPRLKNCKEIPQGHTVNDL